MSGRFGSVEGLVTGAAALDTDDLAVLPTTIVRTPASPPAGNNNSGRERSQAPRPRPAKPSRTQHFVYAAVTPSVRTAAPRLAARSEEPIANLAIRGLELLAANSEPAEPPVVDGPPLTARREKVPLIDMQIRVTRAQKRWLEAQSAERSTSVRQLVGEALTAYVTEHGADIVEPGA